MILKYYNNVLWILLDTIVLKHYQSNLKFLHASKHMMKNCPIFTISQTKNGGWEATNTIQTFKTVASDYPECRGTMIQEKMQKGETIKIMLINFLSKITWKFEHNYNRYSFKE